MAAETPIFCEWNGEAFKPLNPNQAKLADRDYVVGERYRMAPLADRSMQSHNHYFACIAEAWQNLPEEHAQRLPTVEHLRKWALIKAGYCDERTFVCASKAEAQRLAIFVKPMDDYALIMVREATVIQYTAKSQSMRAMGKKEFQESKDKVLDVIAEMIGTTPDTLKQNAGRAA